jgi:large-conductance mechanosensitive channel
LDAVSYTPSAAFGKIVSSPVNEVIMPRIGKLTGNVISPGLFINLSRMYLRVAGVGKAPRALHPAKLTSATLACAAAVERELVGQVGGHK